MNLTSRSGTTNQGNGQDDDEDEEEDLDQRRDVLKPGKRLVGQQENGQCRKGEDGD